MTNISGYGANYGAYNPSGAGRASGASGTSGAFGTSGASGASGTSDNASRNTVTYTPRAAARPKTDTGHDQVTNNRSLGASGASSASGASGASGASDASKAPWDESKFQELQSEVDTWQEAVDDANKKLKEYNERIDNGEEIRNYVYNGVVQRLNTCQNYLKQAQDARNAYMDSHAR